MENNCQLCEDPICRLNCNHLICIKYRLKCDVCSTLVKWETPLSDSCSDWRCVKDKINLDNINKHHVYRCIKHNAITDMFKFKLGESCISLEIESILVPLKKHITKNETDNGSLHGSIYLECSDQAVNEWYFDGNFNLDLALIISYQSCKKTSIVFKFSDLIKICQKTVTSW